jgi:hypothetical protein
LISGLENACRAEGNLPFVDQKLIHFGFLLGMNAMDFTVTPNNIARVSNLNPGFSVGIISDLRLNRYLNLRFTPTLHFGERTLTYASNSLKADSIKSLNISSLTISSIPISLPIYLKYSAERKGNYRPYLIWGAGVSYDLATKANADNPVLLKPLDFYTEFGVGCDIYFSFFKLAPELKYSMGFNNVLTPGNKRLGLSTYNQQFSNLLNSLTSKMLTLTFNFE